jgi:hypothetical protein
VLPSTRITDRRFACRLTMRAGVRTSARATVDTPRLGNLQGRLLHHSRSNHMGTNERHPDAVDRRVSDQIAQTIMREGQPSSLTTTELELDVEPLTRGPLPLRVKARVRYGEAPLHIDAEVVA